MPSKFQRKRRKTNTTGLVEDFLSKKNYFKLRTSLRVDFKSLQKGRRRKTLIEQRHKINWVIQYIEENKITSTILGGTARQEIKVLKEWLEDIDADIETIRKEVELRRQFAFENKIKAKDGNRGDGKTYIEFVNVGLGDCTTITSPSGRVFLMDLGSTGMADVSPRGKDNDKSDKELRADRLRGLLSSLQSDRFLGTDLDKLDGLIISHTDSDHHNLMKPMLTSVISSIGLVYFGGASDLSQFSTGGTSGFIRKRVGGTSLIKCVTVRENTNGGALLAKLNDEKVTAKKGKANLLGKEYINQSTGELIIYTENDENNNEIFRLSILASNVEGAFDNNPDDSKWYWITSENGLYTSDTRSTSTQTNIGSLVLRVKTPQDDILICSDATALTERAMVNLHLDELKKVTVVRIPHHASDTSSSVAFLKTLNSIRGAVASCPGEHTTKHHLPKYAILDLYKNLLNSGQIDAHDIWSWGQWDFKAKINHNQITQKLFATGSNGNISYTL